MHGWPFLVARGRRVGRRAVLAPDFLVRAGEQDLLPEQVRAAPARCSAVLEVASREYGPLVVTYREEPVPAAELVSGGGPDALRDRRGRPLALRYGVVTGSPSAPADAHDLAQARIEAILAYRRFLADEEGTGVQPAPGFALDIDPPPVPDAP